MVHPRLHDDELEVTDALARRLIAAQFSRWSDLPLRRIPSIGTANAIYRLGDDLAVRLPRRPGTELQIEHEHRWLSWLAPQLPLPIPETLEVGAPIDDYPSAWTIARWLDGSDAYSTPFSDPVRAAEQLAAFIRALHAIDPAEGPPPGRENSMRGAPLAERDERIRARIVEVDGIAPHFDASRLTAIWDRAVSAAPWPEPPRWLHGDLLPANLLVRDGQLAGVLDFGCLAVGDPACDLQPAWSVFTGPTRDAAREAFRAAVGLDDAAWQRGRGWSLWQAIAAYPYYRDTNPALAGIAAHTIAELVAFE